MNTKKPLSKLQRSLLDIIHSQKVRGMNTIFINQAHPLLKKSYGYDKSLKRKQVEETLLNLKERNYVKEDSWMKNHFFGNSQFKVVGYVLTDIIKLIYTPQEGDYKDE